MLSWGVIEMGKTISVYRNVKPTVNKNWFDFIYVHTMISMCMQRSLCVYYDLYVYTTISMCILQSLCLYYTLNVYTMISMCLL